MSTASQTVGIRQQKLLLAFYIVRDIPISEVAEFRAVLLRLHNDDGEKNCTGANSPSQTRGCKLVNAPTDNKIALTLRSRSSRFVTRKLVFCIYDGRHYATRIACAPRIVKSCISNERCRPDCTSNARPCT